MQMFRTLAILLTSLFISATTLGASVAANGFSQPSLTSLTTLPHVAEDDNSANERTCDVSVGFILSEDAYKFIETAGGFMKDYQHEKAAAIYAAMVKDFGPSPFEADEFVFAKIANDNDIMFMFAFKDGCLTYQQRLPERDYNTFMEHSFGSSL